MRTLIIFIFCLTSLLIQAQNLEVEGKAKVTEAEIYNSGDSVLVWLPDGTIGVRVINWPQEYQVLSISNDTVFLTNGGFAILPDSGGGWTENQDTSFTQNYVGIGTESPKATLDVQGTGFLPPRLTTAQRQNLTNVAPGTVIFNTTTNCLEIFLGSWESLCSSGYSTPSLNDLLGGSMNEEINSIQQTSDGGFILAGFSESSNSGNVSSINNGGDDFWVVKLNGGGVIEWENQYGGSGDEQAHDIKQTNDGGYIVTGESNSSNSGDVSDTNNGDFDYWIVKLDEDGNIEWDILLGGDMGEFARSIQQTSDGGYIVAGNAASSNDGDVTAVNNGSNDYWIVKLDNGGDTEWNSLVGGSSSELAQSIEQTLDGGYIMAGTSLSSLSGDITETTNGSFDQWIVKFDSIGNIEWDRLLGGPGFEFAYKAIQCNDGKYIVAGYSGSSLAGDVTEVSNGNNDFWIVKLDATGNIEWNKLFGGSMDDRAYDISQTSEGGFIVGGETESSGTGDVTETNNGMKDFWVIKLDNTGSMEWNRLFGGADDDVVRSLIQSSDNKFLITGYSDSSETGDVTNASSGSRDIWILTLGQFGNMLH